MKKALIISALYSGALFLEEFANDVVDWQNTLRDYRGFSSISTANGALTSSSTFQLLSSFCGSLVKGDRAAIVMIGHGSRTPDLDGDEVDGYDECYVCSDGGLLTDDQIAQALTLAPSGTVIDLVQEICYAGTADRSAPPVKQRSAPMRVGVGSGTKPAYYRAWQACGEGQLSYGGTSGGVQRSVFSLYLCWGLRAYPFNPATEIMNAVISYVTAAVPAQVPQLSGPNLNAVPF